MNEPKEFLEKSLQTILSKDVDQLVQQLDRRMRLHFRGETHTALKSKGFQLRVLRPALTLALMVVALGVGFYLGNLGSPALGPQALGGDHPSLVLQSKKPAAIALYEFSKTLDLEKLGFSSMTSKVVQNTTIAAEVETTDASDAQADDAASAPSGGASALAPQTAVPVKALNQDSFFQQDHVAETVASIGFAGKEVVVPVDDKIVRWKLNGQRNVVASALRNPIGVSIEDSGRIFVTEYQPDGALIAVDDRGEKTIIRQGLNYPAGIAFAKDHSLYLAEQGRGRVLRFLPLDNRITPESQVEVFATGFSGLLESGALDHPLPQAGPFALTITVRNELLVSDLAVEKTVIYRFRLNPDANWWQWLWGNL